MALLCNQQVALGDTIDLTANSPSLYAYLRITNDSQYELAWWYDGIGGDAQYIPPYSEVENEIPTGVSTGVRVGSRGWLGRITLQTSLTPGTTEDPSPPSSVVRVQGFPTKTSGVIRTIREVAQGAVTVSTAQQLQGVNQAKAVTSGDQASGPGIFPIGAAQDVTVGGTLAGATQSAVLRLSAANNVAELYTNLALDGKATALNGKLLAGNGLPGILNPISQDVLVTSTAVQTLITLTPSANGLFLLVGYVLHRNTAGQALSFSYSYTDPGGSVRSGALVLQGGGGTTNTLAATGTNTFSLTSWAGTPAFFSNKGGGTITVTFRDPAGTPTDLVSACLIWLA